MKSFFARLKELFYAALPILVLFGIPLALSIIIPVAANWRDIPKILSRFADIGNGSWLLGLTLLLFSAIGAFNIGVGFLLTIEKIYKTVKNRPKFWLCVYIVVTALSFVALKKTII